MSDIKDSVHKFNYKTERVLIDADEKYVRDASGRLITKLIAPYHRSVNVNSELPSITFKCDMCRQTVEYISKDEFEDIYNMGYWDTNIHLCGDCLLKQKRDKLMLVK
jgi:hypothetical protein